MDPEPMTSLLWDPAPILSGSQGRASRILVKLSLLICSFAAAMGRVFRKFLGSTRVYACSGCDAHLADEEQVISKSFQGRLGRAFLFEKAINVSRGPVENRMLFSGIHKVADVKCTVCTSLLGWVYLEAKEDSQKYKEGRILLEKIRLKRKGNWF